MFVIELFSLFKEVEKKSNTSIQYMSLQPVSG